MQELAQRLESIERRLEQLERGAAAGAPVVGWAPPERAADPPQTTPPPRPAPSPLPPRPARPRRDVEELLGGRVMGIVGGVAVLLGIAFFVAIAVGRGWIDEPTRVILSYLASGGLVALGAWLHERRGGTQASLAMVGAGVAALFLTTVAASELYDLVPAGLALLAAATIGATATVLAVRWDSRTLAGVGIAGALLAPVLVGAGMSNTTIAYVAIALAAATGVLVWRRWNWLAVAALAVTAPQLASWSIDAAPATIFLASFAFWGLYVGGALGYELRVGGARPRRSSVLLVLAAGALVAASGATGLETQGHSDALVHWFVASLAAAHLLAGAVALRSPRIARPIGLIMLAGGVALGDLAFGLVADGATVAFGWAASAALMAVLARLSREDADFLRGGVAVQTSLALIHVLAFDAPPGALGGGGDLAGGLAALCALGTAAFAAARTLGEERHARVVLDGVALAALAYASAFTLSGPGLAVAWAMEAVALARIARQLRDPVATAGVVAFLALAAGRAIGWDAQPDGLLHGSPDLASAALALGALALGCLAASRIEVPGTPAWRAAATAAAGSVVLYLASIAIVTGLPPEAGVVDPVLADLGAKQPGQVALSAFWALLGLAGLVGGLVRDERRLRLAGLAVFGLAVGKAFAFDLTALDSMHRAASLVGVGLALLAGAFAYQRMRPGPRARAS